MCSSTLVDETHVPSLSDDDVIEDAYAHQFSDFAEAAGDFDVFLARRRIAAYAKLCISGVMRSSGLCGVDAAVLGPVRVCEVLDSA